MADGLPQAGQCIRVVPARVRPGQIEQFLEAHRSQHTPAVRRQPGFVSKIVMQTEDDPHHVVMLLTWETAAHALAWVAQPEHDVASAAAGNHVVRDDAPAAARRGGYRIVEVAIGPPAVP